MTRRISIRKHKDPTFYVVSGGGKTVKVHGKARAKEIANARKRLKRKKR